eukprot:357723-Chlamydomonas_euryale.AAC.7
MMRQCGVEGREGEILHTPRGQPATRRLLQPGAGGERETAGYLCERDVTSGVRDVTSGVRDVTSGVRNVTSGVRDAMPSASDTIHSVRGTRCPARVTANAQRERDAMQQSERRGGRSETGTSAATQPQHAPMNNTH